MSVRQQNDDKGFSNGYIRRLRAATTKKVVDYAVLHTGQQIPESSSSSEEDDNSEDDGKKKKRKRLKKIFSSKKQTKIQVNYVENIMQQNTRSKSIFQGFNSLQEFVELLEAAKNIVVLVGAGISVSCGIPDFRSANGIYSMVHRMGLQLPEPECLFHIDYFRDDPTPFFQLVKTVFADSPTPSPTHFFLKLLQDKGKLLRVYSQNIDGLEVAAGIDREKCIHCHGTFAWSCCMRCKTMVQTSELYDSIMTDQIPKCKKSDCKGIMKPSITFFGEKLSSQVNEKLSEDATQMNLLLIIGTSLQVSPVADIPDFFMNSGINVPQVVINRTPLLRKRRGKQESYSKSRSFDMSLLGNCDDIIKYLLHECGWQLTKRENTGEILMHSHGMTTFCFGGQCWCSSNGSNPSLEEQKNKVGEFVCDNCHRTLARESHVVRYSCK
jgi:NAD-dependent SIR2 family protein deacetylase